MTHLQTRDGTQVSALTFGTMQFGGRADETASRSMYDAARNAGVNHFDTAVGYTGGASETLLGPMVSAERDAIFLATKVGYAGGCGRTNILSQIDTSRRQLKLDTVDLLYLHRWDPDAELAETFATLAELKQNGVIRHIGVSNYAAWQVMKAQAICAQFGIRIDVLQPMYNIVKRQAEVEILPMAADQGILACTYSPLGGGLLTGKYTRGESGRLRTDQMYAARYGQDWMHTAASGLSDIAAEVGTDPATLAVAWVARRGKGVSPIISARSTAQLAPSLAAQSFVMDDALYARITGLSPTPPPATDRLEETQ